MWQSSQWQEQAAETPQLGKKQIAWRRRHWQLLFQFYSTLEPSPCNDAVQTHGHSFSPQINVSGNILLDIPRDVSQLIPNPVRSTVPISHHQLAKRSVINDLEVIFRWQV